MKKQEFLQELRMSLKQFPDAEIKEVLSYYEEMIGDKIEQGEEEEAVIEALGSIKVISARIQTDLMDLRLKENKNIVKTSNNFFIVLMLCASPALIPLGIAFFAVFFSFFIAYISIVFSFGVTAIALIVAAIPASIIAGINLGAGSAFVVAGVMLILTGVFAMLTIILWYCGAIILNEIVKIVNKMIKKYNKRGTENVNS